MDLRRRRLLQMGAVTGGSLLLPTSLARSATALVGAGAPRFTEPLPTLADLGVLDMTRGGTATLDMVNGAHSFHSTLGAAQSFCYQNPNQDTQNYLGPVIVAKQNQGFELKVNNLLGNHPLADAVETNLDGVLDSDRTAPRSAVHLHGGNTAADSDGGPQDAVLSGDSRAYEYGNTQEAAGLWYHDHTLGLTRLNVHAGLAGGYLIRESAPGIDTGDPLTSKLPTPPYEVPLILQDRMFNLDGTFAYPGNPVPEHPLPQWAPEFFGDVATVNGKAWPTLSVDRGKYRFRVYNGSNARVYDLQIVDRYGRPVTFFQIGTDGGLLNAPVRLTRLVLAPGERADLVVDFARLAPGTLLTMTNSATTPYPDGPVLESTPLPRIMQFTVTRQAGFTAPLPSRLRSRTITRLSNERYTRSAFRVAARRTMTLVEIGNELIGPEMALLNNRTYNNTDFRDKTTPAASNTLEQWDLVNLTGDAHPIHLHFAQFQVLNRQGVDAAGYQTAVYGPDLTANTGIYPPPAVDPFLLGTTRPPAANERGWKDTVLALPGEVTRILVPFGPTAVGAGRPLAIGAAHTGEYVWHCHILEHEDNDMMQRFVIA